MRAILLSIFAACLAVNGCGLAPKQEAAAPANGEPTTNIGTAQPVARTFKSVENDTAVFWVRFSTETGDIMNQLVADFNQGRAGLPVKADYIGGYSEIYRKVTAGILGNTLPAMALAYESMTTEYVKSGAVAGLDPFIADPEIGLSAEELDDFFPAALASNRYAQFNDKLYSFPFSKSVLVMYYNIKVLAQAGIEAPPRTWDEFLEQCRTVKAKTGLYPLALNIDCSTINGFIFSMGGEVTDGDRALFDSPESLKVFKLIETLGKEQLAIQVPPNTYDDDSALAQNRIAFSFRTSSAKESIAMLMAGDNERWGVAVIPQADPANPKTVLYGGNICIFNTTPEQQRTAWEFTRFFTSREGTVRWAVQSGYLPVRKSAADHSDMQKYWAQWEYNRVGFDCLPFAKVEPNLAGWQEVRGIVEKGETAVLRGVQTAEQAVAAITAEANAALDRAR